jgi:hypothetical protein
LGEIAQGSMQLKSYIFNTKRKGQINLLEEQGYFSKQPVIQTL